MDFTTLQLSEMTRLDWKLARRMCDKMVGDKMIINTTPNTRTAIFRFNIGQQILKDTTEKKRIDADPPRDNTSLVVHKSNG